MIVLDASALVKLVLTEENSDKVRTVYKKELSSKERIIIPNLALPESLNAIWKYYILRKELTIKKFISTVNDLISIFDGLEKASDREIVKHAVVLAKDNKITIYDAFYAATSIVYNIPLLTFDKNLLKKASKIGIKTI